GLLEVEPGEIAVVQRGIKFRVELPDGAARGYVCENYGSLFRLPDLGLIGANGLAAPRDFLTPVAAFEDVEGDFEVVAKFAGRIGAPASTTRRSTSWRGTATTRRTSTTSAASTPSTPSRSITPIRRSSPCSRRRPRWRGRRTSTSSS